MNDRDRLASIVYLNEQELGQLGDLQTFVGIDPGVPEGDRTVVSFFPREIPKEVRGDIGPITWESLHLGRAFEPEVALALNEEQLGMDEEPLATLARWFMDHPIVRNNNPTFIVVGDTTAPTGPEWGKGRQRYWLNRLRRRDRATRKRFGLGMIPRRVKLVIPEGER